MTMVTISAKEAACSGANYPDVRLRMEVQRNDTGVDVDIVNNQEDLFLRLLLVKRGSASSGTGTHNLNGNVSASATVNDEVEYSSNSVTYDFRSSSGRNATGYTQVLWQGWVTVPHSPDGTKTLTYSGVWNSPSGDILGDVSVSGSVALPTIVDRPSTPTDVVATRISDTSINVAWSQSSPLHAQPTSNQVEARVNDGTPTIVADITPADSVALATAANRKSEFRVRARNSVGSRDYSDWSAPVFTTPAAPSAVTATKVGSDIQIGWTPNVGFSEHEHVLEHGVDVGGVVTWDGTDLATVTAGTSTYTHAAPDPAARHVYRIRARNTDVAALESAAVQSNVVLLLTAPGKPSVPSPPAFASESATFRFAWVHNPIDTTAQTKRQVRYSLNGGSTWTTGAKTASTDQFVDFAGGTWEAGDAVTFQVRTKGGYDSGSDGDASYSPWSDSVTVTFKTAPVATIVTPADGSTYDRAALLVVLGFSQPEAATFVRASIGLYDSDDVLLEQRSSTSLTGTLFSTRVADSEAYTLKATVTDSNGVVSDLVTADFDVEYDEPVPASATVTYRPDSGIAQIELTIAAASGDLVDATHVSIDRIIDGGSTESIVALYPSSSALTFLDLTPGIHNSNLYRVTTHSADGATSVVEVTLVTDEDVWAYMSKGSEIIRFELGSGLQDAPAVGVTLFKAAGRSRPIGLYAATGDLTVSGVGNLAPGYGSTPEEIRDFLLIPSRVCYRDPSGRRMLGHLAGSIAREDATAGQFSYTVTETS